MSLSSMCSSTRTIQGTDWHNRPIMNISADTWTVQLRFLDELQTYCDISAILEGAIRNHHQVLGISSFMICDLRF